MKLNTRCAAAILMVLGLACAAGAEEAFTGRYVRVSLAGARRTLSLAEVEVFSGGKNVALNCPAVQTTTAHNRPARLAVDGRKDGVWKYGSITHTVENEPDPAWELDLGKAVAIQKIVLWNREGMEARLNEADVLILDEVRKPVAGGRLGKAALSNEVTLRPVVGGGAVGAIVPAEPAVAPPKAPDAQAAAKVDKPDRKTDKADKKAKPATQPARGRPAPKPAGPGTAGASSGTAQSLRLAVQDLMTSFGAKYPKGAEFLRRLDALEEKLKAGQGQAEFAALQREALLANPLLDFEQILLVQRAGQGDGLPANWQGNSSLKKTGYDNQIAVMSPLSDGQLKTVYKPANGAFVGDVDLHFDADRILFSSIGANGTWAVYEMKVDGTGLRQVSPDKDADIDYYDPVYLPNGRIICNSTSGYQGVPCVGGKDYVANLHLMDADGTNIRRLCFEQDNDWCPVMLDNGRVMYLRWEYTDSAHYFSRVLMSMNPDGTDQKAFYGSNSYWPNSLFYARPVPGSTTKFAGIVTGHHGVRRMGELVLFDTARGRFEADGAVQRIPGHGVKVEAITKDRLVDASWPKFLHPFPLSEKYFLTSMMPAAGGRWGIYLVDVFDNLVLLKDLPACSLYEPLPLRRTPRPLVVADRVQSDRKDAVMFMMDVYEGPGLRGVPRGTVKSLRIYQYEYSLRNTGGHYNMGMEGPWDAHLILGTVPVAADGSAMFRVPANTPVAFQPLDKDGKALQLMRSWTVGMPGEVVSCVGCHEPQNTTSPNYAPQAARAGPVDITPWRGPIRGFSFLREVQPVLDKHCIGCHDGKSPRGRITPPNLAETAPVGNFPQSYVALHPFVRRNGPEGDYHLLTPMEFHADTSQLIQMLAKGHHNVQLDAEAWDRLVTWIDLNVPALGTWTERGAKPEFVKRRMELARLYASIEENPEAIPNPYQRTQAFVKPAPASPAPPPPALKGWPMAPAAAKQAQGPQALLTLDLGGGAAIRMVKAPAGEFVMGCNGESPLERPMTAVKIDRPFHIGATEVTLAQYRQFDPKHANGIYDRHYKDQVNRGYDMDADPALPAIRVTWDEAMAFCRWLSERTGKKVTLPTEAQWEWACRAGTDSPMSFGDLETDFAKFANLADVTMKQLAVKGVDPKPIPNPPKDLDFEPKDERFNDGVLHLAKAGSYGPNAWGLHDMHGNAAEWTRSALRPYPYRDDDGRNAADATADGVDKRVVRGGSWYDRPHRATSSFRLGFPRWQRVFNVGFRVVVEE